MTDAELDAALRALTAVDPEPRLTGRVLLAIEYDAPAPRTWPRVAWAAAAVVLCVTAVVGWRLTKAVALPSTGSGPTVVVARMLPVPGLPGPDAPDAPEAPEAPGEFDAPGREAPVSSPRAHGPMGPAEAWPYSMPALDPVVPLAVDRLVDERIREERVTIVPLSIDHLEVEVLDR